MQLSCATLMYCRNTKRFLIIHPTGSPTTRLILRQIQKYQAKSGDFPKDLHEQGESYLATALRELKEETDIDADPDKMIDIGRFKYRIRQRPIRISLHRR